MTGRLRSLTVRGLLSAVRVHLPDTADELSSHIAAQEETIKALADAGEEMLGALILLETAPTRAATAISEAAERMIATLRGAGRLP